MSLRNCALCTEECTPDIGVAITIQTVYWGGKRTGTEYGPRLVSFFCTEEHRNVFLELGAPGGELQRKTEIEFDAGPV